MIKSFWILCFLFLQAGYLSGQCPDRAALWRHLDSLRNSPAVLPPEQLKQLLPALYRMTQCHFTDDSTYVFLLQRIGIAYHKSGDDVRAFHYTKASIDAVTANAGTGRIRPDQLMRSYYNLSIIDESLALVPEGNNALDSFINLALKMDFYMPQLYDALFDRTKYCFYAGDYQGCLSYSSIPDLLPANPDTVIGHIRDRILTYRLNALLALQHREAAEKLLATAMAAARTARNEASLGTLYGIAANIARDKGAISLALADFRQEFRYFRNVRYNSGCAESLNAIGYLCFEKLHDPRSALRYYRRALSFDDETEAISTYDNIAVLFAAGHTYDSAFFYFRQAFDQIGPLMDESRLLQVPLTQTVNNMAEYVTGLVLDKGDVFLQQYRQTKAPEALQQAILVFKAGDRLLNRLKSEQADFTSRLFWRTNSHRLYEHAIETAWLQNDPGNVFYFLEKSRATLLNDQLTEQRWAANEDILKEAQLKRNILYLEKERETTTGDATANRKMQAGLFSAKQALTELQQTIKQRNPGYYRHLSDTASVTLADLRTYLRTNRQSVLELYAGDSAVYTMLITPGHTAVNRIGKADFDSSAAGYMACLADPSRLNHDMPGYIRTAHHLYRLLFPQKEAPAGRIIVSPDGNYFPFESLVTTDALQNPAWFLYDHPVCYTYSCGYLLHTPQTANPTTDISSPANASPDNSPSDHPSPGHSPPDKDFMGMAPVRYAAYQHLPALQGSDLSLQRIGDLFASADQFTAAQASKNRFLQNFARYRCIQLYTHAIGNNGKDPLVYFADSALSLSELIPDNKPATRLVVLSACESGNGQYYRGEGIFSFNREFAALGIPASVVNCWSVDNEATYRVTELFYRYLSTGDPADLALQKAKKEFLQHASRERTLPYYWAAPLLTGTAVTIGHSIPRRHRIVSMLIGSISLLLLGVISYLWRGKHSPLRKRSLKPLSRDS